MWNFYKKSSDSVDKLEEQRHNCSDGRWRASLRLDQHYNGATIFTLVPLRTRIVSPMPGRVKSPVIFLQISASNEKKPRCFGGWRHRFNAVFDVRSFSRLQPRRWVSRSRCLSPYAVKPEEMSWPWPETNRGRETGLQHESSITIDLSFTQNILLMLYSTK